ncbi:hypothetical protein AB3X34_25850, partial [Raoultella terrigena]|uniref:hypothetical protein n=1 Tax=Raoultella terrigena TaxID=577 RepID=UPI00349F2488
FERCAATARRGAGRTPAINCQASNKQRNLMRKHGVFLLSAVHEKRPDANRIGRCAPRLAAKTPADSQQQAAECPP